MHKRHIKLYVGGVLILFMVISPWLFTRPAFCNTFDFSSTGSIGDTIGGITAPIIGLISIFLLYATYMEQRKTNEIQKITSDYDVIMKFYDRLFELIDCFEVNCKNASPHKTLKINELDILYDTGIQSETFLNVDEFSKCHREILNITIQLNMYLARLSKINLDNTERKILAENVFIWKTAICDYWRNVNDIKIADSVVDASGKQIEGCPTASDSIKKQYKELGKRCVTSIEKNYRTCVS